MLPWQPLRIDVMVGYTLIFPPPSATALKIMASQGRSYVEAEEEVTSYVLRVL